MKLYNFFDLVMIDADDYEVRKTELFPEILRDEAVGRLNELGQVMLYKALFSSHV